MKMKLFSVLLIFGILMSWTVPAQAATLGEVSAQVGAYYSSGEIKDTDYNNDLVSILNLAMIAQIAGDAEGMTGYLDAFTVLLQESTADMITAEAASALMSMVP